MKTAGRRSFLKTTGGALAGACIGQVTTVSAAGQSADLVLKNGVLITMNDAKAEAGAMAVRGGRIAAVGANEEIESFISRDTEVIDLAGACVSPGLIDAHSHVIGFGQMQLKFVILRPPEINSFSTLGNALARAAQAKPRGQWIIGRGFDTFKEGRFPRRWELDEMVPNHPLLIIHWGGQFGAANTAALKEANLLNADTQDPYGGKYLRDRNGVPDGVLLHYPAIYSVYQPELDEREQVECAAWGLKQFAALGVTCIHDNFCHPVYARTYVRLEQTGQLPCRMRIYPYVKTLDMCRALTAKMRPYHGARVRLQGIKLAMDGYALMYNVPDENRHLGIPMHPQPVFEQIIDTIHRADSQADVHAVGDKGVDWTLQAFARAAGKTGCRERRHRIEHFPFRKPDSIERAAELGVPVCVQPAYLEIKAEDFAENLGPQSQGLVDTMLPLRSFDEAGVRTSFGADVPAFPSHSPLDSIRCAMDRLTSSGRQLSASESVTFMQALRYHTLGGAYAAFDEEDIGSLEAGKQADFVIWNNDLRAVQSGRDAIALRPKATYLSGKPVYEAA